MERTLVLIKPEAVEKEVWFWIIKLYENHSLMIAKTKVFAPLPTQIAEQLYAEHKEKDFYPGLFAYVTSGITIALCVVGDNAVAAVRAINGATKPNEAAEGTIRKLYGTDGRRNAAHGSANLADAERECKIVFGDDEPVAPAQ